MRDYLFEILLVGGGIFLIVIAPLVYKLADRLFCGGINRKIKLCKRIQKHIEECWEAEERQI